MTMLEKVARAIARTAGGSPDDAAEWEVWLPEARAALLAVREPVGSWLAHQAEHGFAPDGYPVEMSPEYSAGRTAAFQATIAMIDASLDGEKAAAPKGRRP